MDKQDRLTILSHALKSRACRRRLAECLFWVMIGSFDCQHLKLNESQCSILICACHSPYHGLHARLLVQIVRDRALSGCFLSQSIERITNKIQARTKTNKRWKTKFCLIWWIKYHLLTESEVIKGKSQTEALMYLPSDSEVDTSRPRSEISL